ncbi:MAG: esterase/lipase family protein [Janthinobacterium lividum]
MVDGVLLLHGIARTSASMRALQRALEGEGYAVLNLDYRSRHLRLDALADAMHPAVARFADAYPGGLHVVAHSMGGLLARVYLARNRPARLGRVVMLGTPNGGSEVADALRGCPLYRLVFGPAGQQLVTTPDEVLRLSFGEVDYDLGVLAGDRPLIPLAAGLLLPGPNDGKVTVASTRLLGMADHCTVRTSHTRLVSHPEAIAATLRFLRHGRFGAAP